MKATDKEYHIKFKSIKYGAVTLFSQINPLNGNWMYWTDLEHSMYYGDKRNISSIVKHLRKTRPIFSDDFDWIKK